MNWITTNIRFPEDMYMELKMEAARKRKSVAGLIREKVGKKSVASRRNPEEVKKIMAQMRRMAKNNAKYIKGSLSEALIEMRYEQ